MRDPARLASDNEYGCDARIDQTLLQDTSADHPGGAEKNYLHPVSSPHLLAIDSRSGGRIVGVETVDKMTDRQIAARVRQRFHR